MCGVLLLGTDKTDNTLNLTHMSLVQPLTKLGAEHIKKIDEIVNDVEKLAYEKKYDFGNYSLAEAFWLASKIFSDQTVAINKSIVLFTNDDEPVQNQNDRNRVITSATDMSHNHIILDLIHLGETFDVKKFYKEIVQLARNDFNYNIPNPAVSIQDMINRVNKTNYRHVIMAKIPFFVSDDFVCGVAMRQVTRKVSVPYKVKLSKSTSETVVTKLQLFESETGEVVDDEHLIKSQTVGLKDIAFRKKELEEMAELGERGLRLMGFKPADSINLEHYVKSYSFIYPDEGQYKGSTVFFTALLKRCLAKQKVAICTYYPRTTSSVRFVALIAQDEILNPDNTQKTPPGFLVYSLPFAEEVRETDEKCSGKKRAAPEQVDIARKLIKKLKFRYSPECFPNPKLRHHWAAVEALALDLPEPENVPDLTIPDYERISTRTHDIAERFKEECYPEGYEPRDDVKPSYKKTKPDNLDLGNVEKTVRDGNVSMNLRLCFLAIINKMIFAGE